MNEFSDRRPCAYDYGRADRQCPNPVSFPDGRDDWPDWRKARAACLEHLPEVIWQMQHDHGHYDGAYLLRAEQVPVRPRPHHYRSPRVEETDETAGR